MKKFKIIMLAVVIAVLSTNLTAFAGDWAVGSDGVASGKDITIELVRIDDHNFPSIRLDSWPAGVSENLCFGGDPRLVKLGTEGESEAERVGEISEP